MNPISKVIHSSEKILVFHKDDSIYEELSKYYDNLYTLNNTKSPHVKMLHESQLNDFNMRFSHILNFADFDGLSSALMAQQKLDAKLINVFTEISSIRKELWLLNKDQLCNIKNVCYKCLPPKTIIRFEQIKCLNELIK